MRIETGGELSINNLNEAASKLKEFLSEGSASESSEEGDSDEDFEDYRKDGYHPAHLQ
jgi:hypothetical protein